MMENKEDLYEGKQSESQREVTNNQSIVVDIEQGRAYDMDKDFKQVGKSGLYFIILQFCIAFVLVFVVSMFMVSSVIWNTNGELRLDDLLEMMVILIMITTALSSFLSGWLVVRSAQKKLHIDKAELRRKNPWDMGLILKYTVIAMGFSTIAGFVVMGLDMIVNLFDIRLTTPDFSLTSDMTSNIFMLLSVLVVAPIFEELLCRGVILRTLQRYNTRFAIIVSSIIFGLLHMNIIQGLPAFAIGLVFAYVSVKANSVIPSMIMHFINNAFAMVATAMIGRFTFAEIGFLVFEILMMLFAVYYLVSHRNQFLQDEDLNVSAKGYYRRFFNCWPNVLLIALCSIVTILSYTIL